MLPTEQASTSIPAFLAKLWNILADDRNNELIAWNSNGMSFMIKDQARFTKELLPHYFKHANIASFIRQLNMYGFKKVSSLDQGLLHTTDRDEVTFQHSFFLRDDMSLLGMIKRKNAPTKADIKPLETSMVATGNLNKMLEDIKHLKSKQNTMDTTLSTMKKENETLWRELVSLRHKHSNQQKVVNKLIRFLARVIQQNAAAQNNSGLKRKLVPMIEDSQKREAPSKMARQLSITSAASRDNNTGGGPVIHDVTDILGIEELVGHEPVNVDSVPSTSSSADNSFFLEEIVDAAPIIEIPKTPSSSAIPLSPNPGNVSLGAATNDVLLDYRTGEVNSALDMPPENLLIDPSLASTSSSQGNSETAVSLTDNVAFRNVIQDQVDNTNDELVDMLKTIFNPSNVDQDSYFLGLGEINLMDFLQGSNLGGDDSIAAPLGNIVGNELVQVDNDMVIPSFSDLLDEPIGNDGDLMSEMDEIMRGNPSLFPGSSDVTNPPVEETPLQTPPILSRQNSRSFPSVRRAKGRRK